MVLLRLLDPEHVVEKQVLAIGGRQPAMGAAGAADDDLPELPGFGMNAKVMPAHAAPPVSQALAASDPMMKTRQDQQKRPV